MIGGNDALSHNRKNLRMIRAKSVVAILFSGAALAFYRAHPPSLPTPYRNSSGTADRTGSSRSANPTANLTLAVTVTGAAERTGVVTLINGTTLKGLLEAVRPKPSAYTAHADYGYVLRHGDEIHIPTALPKSGARILLSDETLLRIRIRSQSMAADAFTPQAVSQKTVNINRATLEELQKLPRIGPETARRIVQERETHGPFKRKEELLRVRGIGRKTFEWLEPLIRVE